MKLATPTLTPPEIESRLAEADRARAIDDFARRALPNDADLIWLALDLPGTPGRLVAEYDALAAYSLEESEETLNGCEEHPASFYLALDRAITREFFARASKSQIGCLFYRFAEINGNTGEVWDGFASLSMALYELVPDLFEKYFD